MAHFLPLLEPALIRERTITSAAKKMMTPKQKKVTVLSVIGPASPVPVAAIAAGAARSAAASAASSAEMGAGAAGRSLHAAKSTWTSRASRLPRHMSPREDV